MVKRYIILPILIFLLILACSSENVSDKAGQSEKVATNPVFVPNKEIQAKVYRLDTLFLHLTKAKLFNGNVLVAQKGVVIYQKSFGVANNETGLLLSDSSLFQLASVSKTITSAAILKLVEAGKLNLNEDIKVYLNEFPYKGVKLEHLISHRSGLPNYLYFCSPFIKEPNTQLSNEQVMGIIKQNRPETYCKPGIRFNYSNTNYMLLALIIERVTGGTFKDFVRKEIFVPLRMNNTYFVDELNTVSDSVKTVGYTNRMKEVGYDAFDYVLGDKGVFSTTKDMFRFAEAFFNGQLISPPFLQMAVQPHSPERRQNNYGYGWRMKNFNSPEKMVFHNGWWHGYRTALQRRLRDSTTIIVLSNKLNSSVYQTYKIFQALDGKISDKEIPEEGDGE